MFYKYMFFSLLIALSIHIPLFSSTTAIATITYSIDSIDSISISGNPGPLTISTATAGSTLTTATDNTTTYAVTTNNSSRNITGSVATAMPTGVTLSVALDAPTGATSLGEVALTTTDASLVTGIANLAQASLMITYYLDATLDASQVSGATNTVTYTVGP